jgi:hypothetical protein
MWQMSLFICHKQKILFEIARLVYNIFERNILNILKNRFGIIQKTFFTGQ